MPLSATFAADFSSFQNAVLKAESSLKSFEGGASRVESQLNRMSDSLSGVKIVQQATIAAEAVDRIGGVSKLTEAELVKIGTIAAEAAAKLKAMGQEVPPKIQDIVDAAKQIKPELDKVKTASDAVKGSVATLASGLGLAFGATAVVAGAKQLIGSAIEYASAIDDQSKKLDVSAEKLQGWNAAANLAGATSEDVATAVAKMNANLDGGSKSTVDALKAAGLSFQTIRSMKPEDAFEAIATAIKGIPDPMTQAKVAVELFGKGGQTLLPAIKDDIVKVGAAADKMSNDTVARLDAAGDAWTTFGHTVTIVTGEGIVSISKAAGIVKDLSTNFQQFSQFIADVGRGGVQYAITMKAVRDELEKFPPSLRQFADEHTKAEKVQLATAAAAHKTAEELAAEEAALKEWQKKVKEGFDKFSGKDIQDAANQLVEIIHRMSAAGKGFEFSDFIQIGKQLDDWAQKGAKLDPVLINMREAYIRLTFESDRQHQSLLRLLDSLPKVELSMKRTILTWSNLPPMNVQAARGFFDLNEAATPLYTQTLPGLDIAAKSWFDTTRKGTPAIIDVTKHVQELGPVLSALSQAFGQLAQTSDGEFGDIAKAIGTTIGAMNLANKAGGDLNKKIEEGTANFGDYAIAAAGAVAALDAATSSASKAQNIISGAAAGASFGAAFGPWGAAIGAGAGAIVGWLRDVHNAAADLVAQFSQRFAITDQFGLVKTGAEALREKLLATGEVGEQLWTALMGETQHGNAAAVQRIINDITGLLRGEATAMDNVRTAAERAAQEQVQDDADLKAAIDKYKFSLEELGPAFQRQELNKQAATLLNNFRLLAGAGIDVSKVIGRMSDDINDFVRRSVKMGMDVPIEMKPVLDRMRELGLLTDDNGDKIGDYEAAGIHFARTMGQEFDRVVDKLNDILKALGFIPGKVQTVAEDPAWEEWKRKMGDVEATAHGVAGAIDDISTAMRNIPSVPGGDTYGAPIVPPVAVAKPGGTSSLYRFSSPSGGSHSTTIIEIDSRRVAELVVPHIPKAVHRYRVG